MILTVRDFCSYIEDDELDVLAQQVTQSTARPIDENVRESYSEVSKMLTKAMKKNPAIGDCHIAYDTSMLLEYKLPSASAWCDLILLGKNEFDKEQVVIIELKNWRKNNEDKPGIAEGLMFHNGKQHSHPSDQVKGYTEYCQRFHSTVQECDAECCGVVYFTKDIDLKPYAEAPNKTLVDNYPNFNTKSAAELATFITKKISKSDKAFAKMFIEGVYKQDRSILRQVATMFANKGKEEDSPFVLLGPQRRGYAEIMKHLQDTVACLEKDKEKAKKQVIVVEGPPGSGKSAVAVNLWANAALKYTKEDNQIGNCVFVTTSMSQDDNWRMIFEKEYKKKVARWLIQKASAYKPDLNPSSSNKKIPLLAEDKIGRRYLNEEGKLKAEYWREITQFLIDHKAAGGYNDNIHLLSVVDEAHALINPFSPDFIGNVQSWPKWMGAQAYHIIRNSQVSVFFTDVDQSFREFESTSVEDIEGFAKELGAEVIKISLAGMQFRCSGSVDYVNWVDNLFNAKPVLNHYLWKNQYQVTLKDWPSEVEDFLRKKIKEGEKSVRFLSSYTEKWDSKGILNPDHGTCSEFDFILKDKDGREFRKFWNSTYEAFVQNVLGSTMCNDPLSEVGCPYVVRGFDYTWIGLLWLKDYIYRKELGGWCISFKYVKESAIETIKKSAKKEWETLPASVRRKYTFEGEPLFSESMTGCPMIARLFKAQKQAYRILMTRAMKGMCIYIQDEETRNYVKSLLK